jgi:hypothetical protein
VAATVDGGDLEVGVDLLGRFDVGDHGAAVLEFDAAGVGVDDVGRVDEVAVMLDEPLGSVELAALFIGGEGKEDVAPGLESLAMNLQKCPHQRGIGVFHILRATAVKVAVLFNELKRLGGPVGAESLDYVHVA